MKVHVPSPKQQPAAQPPALVIYTPRPMSFFARFVRACREDIDKKLSVLKPTRKWNGVVPKIEPRRK
jgi:hypothetical protein